ncbi:MAG TPA: carboxylating nicotinate-nucleotide diphosphorylase [Nitrososphaeraceae archaeon]
MNPKKKETPLRHFFEVRKILLTYLHEDIGTGDITSEAIIKRQSLASSTILSKDSRQLVVAGIEEVQLIFNLCKCSSTTHVSDGSIVSKGDEIMKIKGEALNILKAERTALNLLMRMSGIATETRRYVDLVRKISKDIIIAGSRKTAPGLRYFDKKAVSIGGGWSHRNSLDEMVLIKDNHIILTGSIKKSILNAKENVGKNIRVECEVTDLNSAIEAVRAGTDIVMLDNFSPSEVEVAIVELKNLRLRQKCKIEVSGGVNFTNIIQFAKAKPDIISLGSITHSANAADFSLEVDAP